MIYDNLRVITCLGNHYAGVGMANQYYRPVLQRDDALRRRYVVSQRGQGILHSDHMKALRLEERNYSGPTRSIGPGTVNQDDISGTLRGRCLGKSSDFESVRGHQHHRCDQGRSVHLREVRSCLLVKPTVGIRPE